MQRPTEPLPCRLRVSAHAHYVDRRVQLGLRSGVGGSSCVGTSHVWFHHLSRPARPRSPPGESRNLPEHAYYRDSERDAANATQRSVAPSRYGGCSACTAWRRSWRLRPSGRDEKYADTSSTRESRWTADHTPCRNAAAGAKRSLLLAPADAVDAADPPVVPHLH